MRPLKRPSRKLQKAWENETSTINAKNHLDDALKNKKIEPKDLNAKEHFRPAWGEPKWWKEAMVVAQDEQCAWCTVKPDAGEDWGTIDHIRPKTVVHRHFERKSPDSKRDFLPEKILLPGYYWRAYDPTNFAFACRRCNTVKSTLWPVQPWKIASTWKAPCEGVPEKELMLDPFVRTFDPFKHFQFGENGAMQARQDNERAEATMYILHLDRTSLCENRKNDKDIKRVKLDIKNLKRAGTASSAAIDEQELVTLLANNCSWKSSHAAYYRAALKNALQEAGLTWSFLRDAWDQLGLAADVTEPPDDAWIP